MRNQYFSGPEVPTLTSLGPGPFRPLTVEGLVSETTGEKVGSTRETPTETEWDHQTDPTPRQTLSADNRLPDSRGHHTEQGRTTQSKTVRYPVGEV